MSENPSKNPQDVRKKLCLQLRSLRQEVSGLEQKSVRKRKICQRAGFALVAVCILYMSFLTKQMFKLDAQTLTEFGRLEVQRQLPDGVRELKDYLKIQAPHLISQALQSALDSVPRMRKAFVKDLNAKNAQILEEFEKELGLLAKEVLRAGRANLDALDGDKSDLEKIDYLTNFMAEQLTREVSAAFDVLYPKYSLELNRIESFLVDLQRKDTSELTERERLQKELIETVLQLITVEAKDGEALNLFQGDGARQLFK